MPGCLSAAWHKSTPYTVGWAMFYVLMIVMKPALEYYVPTSMRCVLLSIGWICSWWNARRTRRVVFVDIVIRDVDSSTGKVSLWQREHDISSFSIRIIERSKTARKHFWCMELSPQYLEHLRKMHSPFPEHISSNQSRYLPPSCDLNNFIHLRIDHS